MNVIVKFWIGKLVLNYFINENKYNWVYVKFVDIYSGIFFFFWYIWDMWCY